MNDSTIITTPAISVFVAEVRPMLAELREAEGHEHKLGKAFEEARQHAQRHRMMVGRELIRVRGQLPKRGTPTTGWGAFLGAVELDEATAWRYIKLAEATLNLSPEKDRIPTYAEVGLDKREGPEPDPDAPPPSDADAPSSEGEPVIEINEPAPPPNRDGWCTPDEIVAALPEVDLDPCGNPFSSVRAKTVYMLEAGQDGLELPWFGLLYVNGPYSKLLPWAERLDRERSLKKPLVKGAGFMVNADSSPAWWHLLVKHLPIRLDFNERIEFKPPPGVEPSKNDRAQSLLMDEAFWKKCNRKALLAMGTLWERRTR